MSDHRGSERALEYRSWVIRVLHRADDVETRNQVRSPPPLSLPI